MTSIQLKFYLAGVSPEQQTMLVALKKRIKESYGEQYQVMIIDVFEHPELADDDKILATPTVIRTLPNPIKKFILDMSSHDKFLLGMNLVMS